MVTVLFYEKPGCASNARQKQILRQAGATLSVRNLLTESWTAPRLRTFFGTRPVPEWFNPSAPAIKSGDVDPLNIGADSALAAMLVDPLLIRRPLIEADEFRCSGFDWPALAHALGLQAIPDPLTTTEYGSKNLESCSRDSSAGRCSTIIGGQE